jgi:hypothetical protein
MHASVNKQLTNFQDYFAVSFRISQGNGYVCLRGQRYSMSSVMLSASHGLNRLGLD